MLLKLKIFDHLIFRINPFLIGFSNSTAKNEKAFTITIIQGNLIKSK